MAFLIFIAFLTVPIVEIAVFIEVGDRIGLWPTIGIVVLTAIIGTSMLRQQGLSVLFRIQENLQANRMPIRELFDGVCLVIAGALLLTPGFVTDALGFLLFIPPFRHLLAQFLAARMLARADVRFSQHTQHPHGGVNPNQPGGPVIDGECEEVTPSDTPNDDHPKISDKNDQKQ